MAIENSNRDQAGADRIFPCHDGLAGVERERARNMVHEKRFSLPRRDERNGAASRMFNPGPRPACQLAIVLLPLGAEA